MAKDTLLEIVQQILSDADGDQVNSIADTMESQQCANLVIDVHNQIVDQYDMRLHKTLKQLNSTGVGTPTIMTRPEGFYDIEWIRYDKRLTAGADQEYREITYLDPDAFVELTSARTLSNTEVEAMTMPDSGHVILIENDKHPDYYTMMEGYDSIIFDSYLEDVDTTLQSSKVLAFGTQLPTLTYSDGAVPNLPQHLMVLLRREARALYFDLYKDGLSSEVDRTRRRAEVRAQRHRRIMRNTENHTGQNYGRK